LVVFAWPRAETAACRYTAAMHRDMDLVRRILLAMEANEDGFAPANLTFPDYDQEVIGHHVWLMEQGDLITAAATTVHGEAIAVALPLEITWRGYEFLAAVRDDAVWAEVRRRLKAQGMALPLVLLQELALKILAEQAGLPHD
jgi:hypothetical protein